MVTMGWPEVLDRHIPRQWTPRGRRWGWTAVIWRASRVTEGDHRNVSGETYLKGRHHPLRHLTAQVIEPLDVSDDRLRHRLQHVRKPAYGHPLAHELKARRPAVDDLSQDVIRCEATTGSGAHEVTAGGLGPFGPSQDDPTRLQINVRLGSLDPVGMPLATAVWSGERADEGCYLPIIERRRRGWNTTGRLWVGDGTMRAWDTRASLARHPAWSLSPLPLTGATAEARDAWSTAGVTTSAAEA